MPSVRARLFYWTLKVFFRYLMPSAMPLTTYRKITEHTFFERLPRDIRWEPSAILGVPGEWITPPTLRDQRVLLYLHGGGYALRTPHVHRVLVGRLARATGCRAFVVDYRLAPEHPFPAALEDVLTVYQGLQQAGYTASQIVVAGDSAGGGLTMGLLLRLRDMEAALPAAACLLSALLDCTFSGKQLLELQQRDPYLRLTDLARMAGYYYGSEDPHHPLISPLWASLERLPPLLVMAGTHEILLDEAVAFAERAQEAGVVVDLQVWPGMIHAFPIFAAFIPEGKAAIEAIGAFFGRHLAP